MAVKKSYNRYFIIFQEEDKGYGVAIDKQPTGYTKIENRSGKCKITVYAQNLVKEKGPYYCCLVDSTKDPLVMARLGVINIDDTGRGETWWEFREDDIADTGVPYDRFNVAAVITGDNKINAPLAGYIGKDKASWKDRVPYVANAGNEPVAEKPLNEEPVVKEEPEELDEEAKKFKEYEEGIKADKENDGERWKKEKDNKENVKGESKSKDDKKDGAKSKGNENKDENKKDENKKENVKSESEKSESKKENSKDSADKDNKKDDPRKEGTKAESKEEKKAESKEEGKAETKEGAKAEAKETEKAEGKAGANENPKEGAVKEEAAKESGKQPNVIEPFNYDEDIEAKEVSGYLDDSFNKGFDRKGDKDKRPFATMFHDILEDFDEEDDLTDEFKNTRWWKIPLSDDIPISENLYYPYYCAIYHLKMTYPYINYIKHFKDTGHYHFGMKYDDAGEVKYIIYGIEGKNSSNFQPYMGMTGFIRWIKMKNHDNGMWVMYYNPHTGNIMIPKKR